MPSPPSKRIRTQLAIQATPELLDRLRAAAAAQHRTTTSLVVEWIEAGLDGRLGPPDAPGQVDALVTRLEALEAAVAALQRQPSSDRVSRPSPSMVNRPAAAAAPASAPPPEAITTTDLAALLGLTRVAMNSSIARAGGAVVGLRLRGWRCVGQWRSPAGGRAPWWWVPDTDTSF